MKTKSFIFSLLLLLLSSGVLYAQNGVNSPYSRYGFGMMSDRAQGFNKGMGGVSQGFRSGQEVNVSNPASYSTTDSLTALIDFGLSIYNGNYKMGNIQKNAQNSSIDYFSFQFRAFKGLGISIGILPYTNINYKFSSESESIGGSDDITSSYSFSGNGGLHQIYFGAGWNVFNTGLSLGANASYLYGDYEHTSTMSFSESSAYSMVRSYTADISTWKLDLGMQYAFNVSKSDELTLGATFGLGHKVKNNAHRTTKTLNSSSEEQGSTIDVINNAFELPNSMDFGLAYRHGTKWRLGGDFGIEKWSKCKFPVQDATNGDYVSTTGQLYDRVRFGLGYELTPNVLSRKLTGRMSYKFGAYYSKSYACADPTGQVSDKPYEYGLSAGISIPISNRNLWHNSPKLNIALQWVHSDIPYLNSTNVSTSHLVENYLKLCVGLTFSERWFYKWKVQ